MQGTALPMSARPTQSSEERHLALKGGPRKTQPLPMGHIIPLAETFLQILTHCLTCSGGPPQTWTDVDRSRQLSHLPTLVLTLEPTPG